ncbi:MAG: metallophosphoesterase [Spirochaetales bacterium]|nr:metallophosphoesterase [Spirochaetales bacterium]
MRLLCVSDQVDPLVYSTSIRERFKDVDAVLSAGDLPMEYLSFIASCLNKPLFFVFGNHNLAELSLYRPGFDDKVRQRGTFESRERDRAHGATYVGFRSRRDGGLIVAGLGGSMRYNKGLNQYTEAQMTMKALSLVPALLWNRVFHGRAADVILTHAPPSGIHDRHDPCHRGFRVFLWLMRTFKPRYLVHGHVHLYDMNDVRVSSYRDTTVVNAFGHCIVDTEDLDR